MKRTGTKQFDDEDMDDGYYDDDDYYYDEEEEEYYEEEQTKKSNNTTTTTTAKWNNNNKNQNQNQNKRAPDFALPSGYGGKHDVKNNNNNVEETNAPDQDLIDSMMPVLRSTLLASGLRATNYSQKQLNDALRAANYDVNDAVEVLKKQPTSSTNVFSTSKATSASPAASPTTSKPKVLSIGGGAGKKNNTNDTGSASPSRTTTTANSAAATAATSTEHSLAGSPAQSPTTNKAPRNMPKCALTEVKDKSGKTQLSIVFAGHVDHGKSTCVGHLLAQLGYFTEKEVQKMEKAAKNAGKATFHFAWLLDQSDEERRRGVTIDSGIHAFETDRHTVAILDAPGHEQFIENMANSSAQADVAVLIISGKPDELAVGIEHNTRKHVQILKRIGISRLIVAINKMDAVEYSQEAFNDAREKVAALVETCGFRPKEDVVAFLPISGLAGANLTEAPDAKEFPGFASWYTGPCLLDVIDQLDPIGRMHKFPLRFVVNDVNPKGTISGKVVTGSVSAGDTLLFLPSNCKVTVRSIEHSVTGSTKQANAGDTVDIATSSDIAAVSVGNIGCPHKATKDAPHCLVGSTFEASIQTYGQHARPILPGHSFVMMVNGVQVQARIRKLLQKMDMSTGNWGLRGGIVKMIPRDVQGRVLIELEYSIPFERSSDCMPLGKFLMKQELNIVGGGLIEEVAASLPSTTTTNGGAAVAA